MVVRVILALGTSFILTSDYATSPKYTGDYGHIRLPTFPGAHSAFTSVMIITQPNRLWRLMSSHTKFSAETRWWGASLLGWSINPGGQGGTQSVGTLAVASSCNFLKHFGWNLSLNLVPRMQQRRYSSLQYGAPYLDAVKQSTGATNPNTSWAGHIPLIGLTAHRLLDDLSP